ncbi:Protein MODIFIER OF SNC1 11 [Bienertia sinuspersici]
MLNSEYRFGIGAGSESFKASEEQKTAEDLKRKARAERFGISVPSDEDAKKKARVARFSSDTKADKKADPIEEEKRKARAQRFAQTPSDAVPHTNGKEDVDSNTPVATNGAGEA